MTYMFVGSMRTTPGNRDAVVEVLLGSGDAVQGVGCLAYLVGTDDADPDLIWVSEVWESKQAHDDSLTLPEVRDAISRAMPMLAGEFTSGEATLVGGLGAPGPG